MNVLGQKHAGNFPRPLGRRERPAAPVSAPSRRPLTPDPCPRAKPAPLGFLHAPSRDPAPCTVSAERSSASSCCCQYPDSGATAAANAASPLPQRQLRQPLHPPTPVTQIRRPHPMAPRHWPFAAREAAMQFDRVICTSLTGLLPKGGRGVEAPPLSPPYSLNQQESRVFPLAERQRDGGFDWSSFRRWTQSSPSKS